MLLRSCTPRFFAKPTARVVLDATLEVYTNYKVSAYLEAFVSNAYLQMFQRSWCLTSIHKNIILGLFLFS